ncbi:MAG TPA: hypothetical protein VFE32_16845 [Puia sp.]|jgi:hypothetical protein|nr:hypothetical protein [Puia sp.]
MQQSIIAVTLALLLLSACKGRSGHEGSKDSGLQFSVDTAELKHMDSMRVAERRTDSILQQRADSAPGINAGAGRFIINVPRGWRRVDTLLGVTRAVVIDTASVNSGFRTILSIVGDSLRGRSVDDYMNGTINSFVQYVPEFSLIGKGERTFGSRPGRWLHYTQNREGMELEDICYLIPDKGIVYIVTCSALKGRLLASRPAFEEVVTSFTPGN